MAIAFLLLALWFIFSASGHSSHGFNPDHSLLPEEPYVAPKMQLGMAEKELYPLYPGINNPLTVTTGSGYDDGKWIVSDGGNGMVFKVWPQGSFVFLDPSLRYNNQALLGQANGIWSFSSLNNGWIQLTICTRDLASLPMVTVETPEGATLYAQDFSVSGDYLTASHTGFAFMDLYTVDTQTLQETEYDTQIPWDTENPFIGSGYQLPEGQVWKVVILANY